MFTFIERFQSQNIRLHVSVDTILDVLHSVIEIAPP